MVLALRQTIFGLALVPALAAAQEAPESPPASSESGPSDAVSHIQWDRGPTTAKIANVAEIRVPSGFKFTGAEGARAFLTSIGSQPSPKTVGLLVPLGLTPPWVVAFTYEEIGRVPTDNTAALNADDVLPRMKEGLERLNAARRAVGGKSVTDLQWIQKPTYDPERQILEWSVHGVVPGEPGTSNYDVRLLGRRGVMKITIATSADKFDSVVKQIKPIIQGFQFTPENRYSDWQPGDQVASMELADLVAGAPSSRGFVGFLKSDQGILILALGGGAVAFAAVMVSVGVSLSRKQKQRQTG
jgi:uncharacterized membrane-anchored protein